MVQRRRLNAEVDDEMRRYFRGQSAFNKEIELALERSDPLTRELVSFRANGGDYRQAVSAIPYLSDYFTLNFSHRHHQFLTSKLTIFEVSKLTNLKINVF